MSAPGKLTDLKIKQTKKPGYYGDGGGLWLRVTKSEKRGSVAKGWCFRYSVEGRAHEVGLGGAHTISLIDAREQARECRQWVIELKSPKAELRAKRLRKLMTDAKNPSFADCAGAYIESHRAGWRNQKHAGQWTTTLAQHAGKVIGHMPVREIETEHVMQVLTPIWTTIPETAGRLRGRIEKILDAARVQGFREGENPARWRGHLEALLPTISKKRRVVHHSALPYRETATFMEVLRKEEGLAARALELVILTASRTGEVIGAQWAEIDMDAATWTIPGSRMKAGEEHRIPLSTAALKLLKTLPRVTDNEHIFPAAHGKPMSNMAMLALLKRMGRNDITTHGFRSSFRDWAAEQTGFAHGVAEAALAHRVHDATVAAYQRGDLFEKRAKLMGQWATYCGTVHVSASVVPIRSKT